MKRLRTGLYDKEYGLIDQARALLASPVSDPAEAAALFGRVLGSFEKLLLQTEKVNYVADRHYTRLVKTQKNLIEANKELEVSSVNDKLTGLYNRRKLEEVLALEVLRLGRSGGTGSLIFGDIDHFKRTNDNYGHLIGDQVLVQFAGLLSGNIRKTDYCFRWGGEEFLILLTETRQAEAEAIAEKLRAVVESSGIFPSGAMTASFGVQEYRPGWDQETWVSETDRALYRAKIGGRNRVEGPLADPRSN